MDNTESLKRAIAAIKKSGEMKGQEISDGEIANKACIPENQLRAFLKGEEKIPDDFLHKILKPFHIIVQDVLIEDIVQDDND